mgnify:CR=1 FL=1
MVLLVLLRNDFTWPFVTCMYVFYHICSCNFGLVDHTFSVFVKHFPSVGHTLDIYSCKWLYCFAEFVGGCYV